MDDPSYIGCFALDGLPPTPFAELINTVDSSAPPPNGTGAVVDDTPQACSMACIHQNDALFAFRPGQCACGWLIPNDTDRVDDVLCRQPCPKDPLLFGCPAGSNVTDPSSPPDPLIWTVHYANLTTPVPSSTDAPHPAPTTVPAAPTAPPPDRSPSRKTWIIPVAILALLVLLLAAGILGWWCFRRRIRRRRAQNPVYPPEPPPSSRRASPRDRSAASASAVAVAVGEDEARWIAQFQEPSALSHSHSHGNLDDEAEKRVPLSPRPGATEDEEEEEITVADPVQVMGDSIGRQPSSPPARRIQFELGADDPLPEERHDQAPASAASSYHHLHSLVAIPPPIHVQHPPVARSSTEPGRLPTFDASALPPSPTKSVPPPRRNRSSWLRLSLRLRNSDAPTVRRLRSSFGVGLDGDDEHRHWHEHSDEGPPTFLSDQGHYPSLQHAEPPSPYSLHHPQRSSFPRAYSDQGHFHLRPRTAAIHSVGTWHPHHDRTWSPPPTAPASGRPSSETRRAFESARPSSTAFEGDEEDQGPKLHLVSGEETVQRHPVYPSLPLSSESLAPSESSIDGSPEQDRYRAATLEDDDSSAHILDDCGPGPATAASPHPAAAVAASRPQASGSFVVTRMPKRPFAPVEVPFWRSRLNSVGSFGTAVLAEDPQTLSLIPLHDEKVANPDSYSETRSIASARGPSNPTPRLPSSSLSRPSRISVDRASLHPSSPASHPSTAVIAGTPPRPRTYSPAPSHDSQRKATPTM